MFGRSDARVDTAVMIFSGLAVLIAATLTMATISNAPEDMIVIDQFSLETPDPMKRAEIAANSGFEAAKNHIECHGRISAGDLAARYFANGATYTVEWDDVDMTDSTTMVRSKADFSWGGGEQYQVELESKIKLDFLPSHDQEILNEYYSVPPTSLENINKK
ncbi:MAG: hypothetical protein V3W18_09300 [candidate division Zixibacteria bacterium]